MKSTQLKSSAATVFIPSAQWHQTNAVRTLCPNALGADCLICAAIDWKAGQEQPQVKTGLTNANDQIVRPAACCSVRTLIRRLHRSIMGCLSCDRLYVTVILEPYIGFFSFIYLCEFKTIAQTFSDTYQLHHGWAARLGQVA